MSHTSHIPKSVGIIMDGNRRWAKERGLSAKEGHTAGMVNMIRIASHAFARGADSVVCYSLSTENLSRTKEELAGILGLVIEYFDAFLEEFRKLKVCAKIVGDLEMLPPEIRASLKRTESLLSEFEDTGKTIYVAVAYGSRNEIVRAVNRAVLAGEPVSEEGFLATLDLPTDLDLIIRTGGDRRLSNFFLYQSSYAELYFADQYFPAFSTSDLDDAFEWFAAGKRRHGR